MRTEQDVPLTLDEASELFRVAPATIRQWIGKGILTLPLMPEPVSRLFSELSLEMSVAGVTFLESFIGACEDKSCVLCALATKAILFFRDADVPHKLREFWAVSILGLPWKLAFENPSDDYDTLFDGVNCALSAYDI